MYTLLQIAFTTTYVWYKFEIVSIIFRWKLDQILLIHVYWVLFGILYIDTIIYRYFYI